MSEYYCEDCQTKITTRPWPSTAGELSRFLDIEDCPIEGCNGKLEYI